MAAKSDSSSSGCNTLNSRQLQPELAPEQVEEANLGQALVLFLAANKLAPLPSSNRLLLVIPFELAETSLPLTRTSCFHLTLGRRAALLSSSSSRPLMLLELGPQSFG